MKVKVIKTILKQIDYSKRYLQFDINKSHLLSNPGKAESSIHFEIFPRLFSPCSPPLPSLVKLHHSSFPPTGRTRLEFRKSPVRGSFSSSRLFEQRRTKRAGTIVLEGSKNRSVAIKSRPRRHCRRRSKGDGRSAARLDRTLPSND